jgi:hypothetical protein
MSVNLEDLTHFVNKHWFTRTGLVVGLLAISVAGLPLLVAAKASIVIGSAIWLITVVMLLAIWCFSRRIPRTPKKKVGFLVSINCSDDNESKRLKEDFIVPLRQLVKSGATGSLVHFIELPQHHAQRIIGPDEAQELRIKSRARFILYGRVRLRKIEGQEHHIVELEGVVSHRPVSDQISAALAQEFTELLPRRVQISTENDLFSFQFTSEWAGIVARYIIGIAAACSGDVNYAEALYREASEQLSTKDTSFPVYRKLTTRIPTRISELYEARAHAVHLRWTETHSDQYVTRLGEFLQGVNKSRWREPRVANLRAIYAFLANRDIKEAIICLRQVKDKNYATWHFNMAFLFQGNGTRSMLVTGSKATATNDRL